MTPHYRQSFIGALIGHFVLITTAVVVSVLPGCNRPKPVDLSAFVNVDILNVDTTKPLSRTKPPPDHVANPPPAPPPPEVHDPVMPVDPVPARPPERTPVKPVEHHDDGATKDHTPPVKQPPVTNAAAAHVPAGPVPVVRSTVRTTRVATVPGTTTRHPVAMRPLTPGELDPLGGINAPLGARNSVPMDERTRCLLLIKRVLYDAWDRPTLADAGRQAALLEVQFDLSGRVVGARISQTSGSEVMDRSVLLAARTVTRVEGLTTAFLKEYPKLTVEFTVTD